MKSIIPPVNSLLPNSAPHILNPISAGEGKTLQVIWVEELEYIRKCGGKAIGELFWEQFKK